MPVTIKPWQGAAALAVLCAGVLGGLYYYGRQTGGSPRELISYLPSRNATVLFVNVEAIRRSGLLDAFAGSKRAEEAEYRSFTDQTHFDYRNDLQSLAAAFIGEQVYFAVRGQFDWPALREYAAAHGGTCINSVCRMEGSRPGRHISFYPLRQNVLALSVGPDAYGVALIERSGKSQPVATPGDEPVWLATPASTLKDSAALPSGTKAFARALANADVVVLSAGPQGQRIELKLDVTCRTPEAAGALVTELQSTTDTLRRWVAREHQTPNPDDLSGILIAGAFHRQDRRVVGSWPVERSFVEKVARSN